MEYHEAFNPPREKECFTRDEVKSLMEIVHSVNQKELASLKEENARLRNKTINDAIAAILSSEHTKSLAIMGAVNDIIKKVESLKSTELKPLSDNK